MKRILKYPINGTHVTTLDLPRGSNVIHIDVQGSRYIIWAEVDETQPIEKRRFVGLMTGQSVDLGMKHISTLLVDNGNFVIHFYEITNDVS